MFGIETRMSRRSFFRSFVAENFSRRDLKKLKLLNQRKSSKNRKSTSKNCVSAFKSKSSNGFMNVEQNNSEERVAEVILKTGGSTEIH